jgi:diphthine-ammonia ligase
VTIACLFSGGKESVYAIQTFQEQGAEVKYLIYEVPSFPSPHVVNMEALKILAKSMNRHLTIVNLHEDGDELVSALKNLKVETLVAGDINVPEHVTWLNDKCRRAGKVKLVEPLWGRNTSVLFREMFLGKSGSRFKAAIIGVDNERLKKEWLGFTLSSETAETFLSGTQGIDPLGENGEYHTIVTESPLYSNTFRIKPLEKVTSKNMTFLRVTLSEYNPERIRHAYITRLH